MKKDFYKIFNRTVSYIDKHKDEDPDFQFLALYLNKEKDKVGVIVRATEKDLTNLLIGTMAHNPEFALVVMNATNKFLERVEELTNKDKEEDKNEES